MTFKEEMESKGWNNIYDRRPEQPGMYKVYRRNGKIGKAFYVGKNIWRDSSGWEFRWWKDIE